METVITYIVFGVFILFSFGYGLKCGQKLTKNESIELPTIPNPIKAVQEYVEQKELDKEQRAFDISLENIDSYDGTPNGQKPIN